MENVPLWKKIGFRFAKGFAVVCIIGIFAAIFIPVQDGYTPHSITTYIIHTASSLKPSIEKQLILHLPTENVDISSLKNNQYISYIKVSSIGEITVFSEKIGTLIVLTPMLKGNTVTWSCYALPEKNGKSTCGK